MDARRLFDEGLAHHRGGRIQEAADRYSRALAVRPGFADALNNLGVACISLGRIEEAISCYGRVLERRPEDPNVHNNLGTAYLALGRPRDALAHYRRAIAIAPRVAGTHFNLGCALESNGNPREAERCYRRALRLQPQHAEAHNNLGNIASSRGRFGEALGHYRRAVAIDPENGRARNNLGNALRDRGRFIEAMTHYDRALAVNPDDEVTHYNRAEIKRFRREDSDLASMERLAARAESASKATPHIHFALGKALEDIGEHDRAFASWARGNRIARSRVQYDSEVEDAYLRRIADVFDRDLLRRSAGTGNPSATPVFIVGMPRSGSTLVERILAGHPAVHAAGELMNFPRAINSAFPGWPEARRLPERFRAAASGAIRQIGDLYLASLGKPGARRARVVDKLPANFLRVGPIRMVFPNARILHVRRNPADTCVSCYSKLFSTGQEFSYDLRELGRYYLSYDRLMKHWSRVLPADGILDVAYEDVVRDIEGQARRIVEFCGLGWDARCLEFHRNRGSVRTASCTQVRRPLFDSSIGRWRRFGGSLKPLLDELKDLAPERLSGAAAA